MSWGLRFKIGNLLVPLFLETAENAFGGFSCFGVHNNRVLDVVDYLLGTFFPHFI